jgi:hypothetical protein
MKTTRRTIERSYILLGTLLHQLRGDYPNKTLCLDLQDLLRVFPRELTVRTELASLSRKPRETWGVVLLATLDELMMFHPPTSSMRINGDVIVYLRARRDGDWKKIREIRASYTPLPENG